MVVLEVFLNTPFTLPYVENLIYFITLTIVIATSYFLLPHILLGKSVLKEGLLILITVNLLRTLWILFSISYSWVLYLVNPTMFVNILTSGIYASTRDTGISSPLVGINLFDALVNATVVKLSANSTYFYN